MTPKSSPAHTQDHTRDSQHSPQDSAHSPVAQETLSYCTSCKMDLNHIIVALKGDKIAKVQCLTCKKEHLYRAPKGVTDPQAVKSKAAKKTPRADKDPEMHHSIELEWSKLMGAHPEVPLKPYHMKGHFTLGDKITHSQFGDGIIGKLIYPNKIEVIFRSDVKILIYAGATTHHS